jgi:excisionase family DNA binding protein
MTTSEAAYLSVAETARLLGLSEPTIYRRVRDGTLPVLRLTETGAIRIPRDVIEVQRERERNYYEQLRRRLRGE